jgi:hypothetical protein
MFSKGNVVNAWPSDEISIFIALVQVEIVGLPQQLSW